MRMDLIQWAFSSSLLLAVILLLRAVLRGRVSPRLIYGLWLAAAVRLMCSVALPVLDMPWSAVSLAQPLEARLETRLIPEHERNGLAYEALIPSELVTWEDVPGDAYLRVPLPYDHAPLPSHMSVDEEAVIYQTVGVGTVTLEDKILPLWLAGVGVTGIVILLSNLFFFRRLRKRRKPLAGTDAPIPVYTAEGLSSPCLFGGSIYLTPEAAADERLREYALAHELTHWRHRDWYWSLVRCGCLVLHWYNPLVWLGAWLSKGDGELACDADTVQRLGEDRRLDYGRALVDLSARRSARAGDLLSLSTAMTGNSKTLRRRVVALVKNRKTARAVLVLVAGVLCLSAAFAFGAGPDRSLPAGLQHFQTELEQAQAIRFSPELTSSQAYPDPINDPDLLAEAKSLLSRAVPLGEGELPDLSAGFHCPRVSLSRQRETDEDTAWSTYYLLNEGDWTYLLVSRGSGEHQTYDPVGKVEWHPYALELVARRQRSMRLEERGLWSMGFSNLGPGAEESKSIRVYPHSGGIQFVLTYGPPSQDLELGLRGEDGTQYVQPVSGGIGRGEFPQIPAGSYELLIRNTTSGDSVTGAVQLWLGEREPAESGGGAQNTLTQEQIDRANEAFRSDVEVAPGEYTSSEISCFFTSSYTDPTRIDLEQFLMYCPLAEILEDGDGEEFQAAMRALDPEGASLYSLPSDAPWPVKRYPREKVSALLQRYAGVTVEELDWSGVTYLEEYDAFYNSTSDFGPGFFVCIGGQDTGEIILLWSRPTDTGSRNELTLRRTGEGYVIRSFLLAPEYSR